MAPWGTKVRSNIVTISTFPCQFRLAPLPEILRRDFGEDTAESFSRVNVAMSNEQKPGRVIQEFLDYCLCALCMVL
jgi:hypothetical protein